jgi:hypothetical protein
MNSIDKGFSLLLLIILADSSLILAESVTAQSIPKPTVPEFTLKYVDNSYSVPPTYGIDPYTGKNVLTKEGYFLENKSIEVIIRNQPFNAYHNENGSLVGLFYDVIEKGHFENWRTSTKGVTNEISLTSYDQYPGLIYRSDSDFTVVTYGFAGNNGTNSYRYNLGDFSDGGQIDFQVKAIIGYSTRINDTFVPGVPVDDPTDPNPRHYVFTGVISDWSNMQTISIPDGAISTSTSTLPNPTSFPTATPTPTVPEFSLMIISPVLLLMLSVAVISRLKKRR